MAPIAPRPPRLYLVDGDGECRLQPGLGLAGTAVAEEVGAAQDAVQTGPALRLGPRLLPVEMAPSAWQAPAGTVPPQSPGVIPSPTGTPSPTAPHPLPGLGGWRQPPPQHRDRSPILHPHPGPEPTSRDCRDPVGSCHHPSPSSSLSPSRPCPHPCPCPRPHPCRIPVPVSRAHLQPEEAARHRGGHAAGLGSQAAAHAAVEGQPEGALLWGGGTLAWGAWARTPHLHTPHNPPQPCRDPRPISPPNPPPATPSPQTPLPTALGPQTPLPSNPPGTPQTLLPALHQSPDPSLPTLPGPQPHHPCRAVPHAHRCW